MQSGGGKKDDKIGNGDGKCGGDGKSDNGGVGDGVGSR